MIRNTDKLTLAPVRPRESPSSSTSGDSDSDSDSDEDQTSSKRVCRNESGDEYMVCEGEFGPE